MSPVDSDVNVCVSLYATRPRRRLGYLQRNCPRGLRHGRMGHELLYGDCTFVKSRSPTRYWTPWILIVPDRGPGARS